MFQNHLLQLLALTAMEPPVALEADAIRNEKIKIFSAIRPFLPYQILKDTLRAQYKGYRDAPAVDSKSQTETFAVLRLYIDNWRWQGVPFYLRSGKAMPIKTTQIVIQFRQPPSILFPIAKGKEIPANKLSFCIQPDEGMHLRFEVKVPDTLSETSSVDMEFHYEDVFGADAIPDAYDRLLMDALKGDASLFTRSDGIEHAWKIMDSIIHGWKGDQAPPLFFYRPGSWGPSESDLLIQEDGYRWERGCQHRDKA